MNQGAPVRFVVPVLLGIAVTAGHAQSPVTNSDSTRGDSVARLGTTPLPELGRYTVGLVLGSAAVAGTLSLFDSRLSADAGRMGGSMSAPATVGSFVGGPGPLALGAVLYGFGHVRDNGTVTQTGREVMRAVIVSGAITAVVKGAVGRARPFAAPGDPDEYRPGQGFTNASFASFPSGHTTAAFATATVLARELNVSHPGARWWTNPLLFGGATFVGLSRVYQRQHWPSDVVAGAALGTITGYEVVAHARGDRSKIGLPFMSHLSVAPSNHGAAIQWSSLH
jgi:membrane-associated phospholipid phosphatase